MTWTKEYASRIVRHTFDRTSPIAQYATVPRPFVFIQRINLGLYALLGDLGAIGQLPAHRRGVVAVRLRPSAAPRWARRRPSGWPAAFRIDLTVLGPDISLNATSPPPA